MHDPQRRGCVRFGPFVLDLESGLLRTGSTELRLSDQPLALLIALLERPGTLVTREDLRGRLWPDGTFVDFEHGLNSAVSRLRDALGDSAGALLQGSGSQSGGPEQNRDAQAGSNRRG